MAAPNILCDCTGMTNEMWLKCREHGPKGNIEYTVGGSDVATIFGLSPWTAPLELWMVKKGRMKPKSPPNPDQLAMGHMLEPIAAHFYAQRTGNTVTDDNYLYQHATLEYALANIDRRYRKSSGSDGGEHKNSDCRPVHANGRADPCTDPTHDRRLDGKAQGQHEVAGPTGTARRANGSYWTQSAGSG